MNLVGAEIAEHLNNDGKFYLCGTCHQKTKLNEVPKLCLANGLQFPMLPTELEGLTSLEERLVALRLPFMKIVSLGCERQFGISGGVVNVPNDFDIVAKVLPRTFEESSTVQVNLSRKLAFKTPYLYQTIRPYRVFEAAKYLTGTELYMKENVILSDEWSNSTVNEVIPFVVHPDEVAEYE